MKRVIWVEKQFFILFKSPSHESWNLTPSFCFSFCCDMPGRKVRHSEGPTSASVDLDSNVPVSATLKKCTWATATKCFSIHPSFDKKKFQGTLLVSLKKELFNPIIPRRKLKSSVYLWVKRAIMLSCDLTQLHPGCFSLPSILN